MTINVHLEEFLGKPVLDYKPGEGIKDPAGTVYRVGYGYEAYEAEEPLAMRLTEYLEEEGADRSVGIVIGAWEEIGQGGDGGAQMVEAIVQASDRLPNLTGIFMADVVAEESEISWIEQADVSPLLEAYPNLTHLAVRGGMGLGFQKLSHGKLENLVIQTGGLSAEVVRNVLACDFPNLKHLELWLGTDDYGGDATVDDIKPLLDGGCFPNLTYLGLRDSVMVDELAKALAESAVIERIKILDLSLGTLTDVGGEALLGCERLGSLDKVDLHHHFMSDGMMDKLKASGVNFDVSGQESADEYDGEIYRYCAVAE